VDEANTHILKSSTARAKVLLDANVLSYAHDAHQATGYHLLDYLDTIKGRVDWFVSSGVAMDLYRHGTYGLIAGNMLNCDYPDMKMNDFPYEKKDGSLGFVKLNTVSGDDWSQICLAYNYPELIIVTNDSKMFKSAHAALNGRAIAFHDFLTKLSPYWFYDNNWLNLKQWLIDNKKPLRNNSSWILPEG
jgi:hypothetical protein